jgi:hypothetical protein
LYHLPKLNAWDVFYFLKSLKQKVMTWFVVFLLVISVLILTVFKAAGLNKKRKQAEKDRVWNEQLENLLQSLTK